MVFAYPGAPFAERAASSAAKIAASAGACGGTGAPALGGAGNERQFRIRLPFRRTWKGGESESRFRKIGLRSTSLYIGAFSSGPKYAAGRLIKRGPARVRAPGLRELQTTTLP